MSLTTKELEHWATIEHLLAEPDTGSPGTVILRGSTRDAAKWPVPSSFLSKCVNLGYLSIRTETTVEWGTGSETRVHTVIFRGPNFHLVERSQEVL